MAPAVFSHSSNRPSSLKRAERSSGRSAPGRSRIGNIHYTTKPRNQENP